ncbi:MAG: prepilin peptidase, partial [Candidatus Paceibacterota bacterium]
GLLFLLFWLLWFLSRGRLMGFGDAKLVFGLGLWLGLTGASYAVALAFIIGAVVGLGLIFISQSKTLARKLPLFTLKSEVPFAPFLVIGAFISYLL